MVDESKTQMVGADTWSKIYENHRFTIILVEQLNRQFLFKNNENLLCITSKTHNNMSVNIKNFKSVWSASSFWFASYICKEKNRSEILAKSVEFASCQI